MNNIDSIEYYLDSELTNPKQGGILWVLQEFGNDIRKDLQTELKNSEGYVSGDLYNHINFDVTAFGSTMNFTLKLEDYFDYVNKGVNGTRSVRNNTPYSYKATSKIPFKYAKDWMNNKGLFVTKGTTITSIATGKSYKAGSRDSQALAMAQSWKHKGTKGNHFYDKVVTEDRIKKLRNDKA